MAQGDLTKLEGRLHTAATSPRRRSRPDRYGRTEWPCVLLAFVIEIYLKGLLAHEGKSARGHEHDKLYSRLGGDAQAKIAARYTQRHHGQVLEADLPAYSKLFVDVRYSYEVDEPRTHDISGVAQLASALYETWVELRPDLFRAGVVHDWIMNKNQGIPIIGS